MLPAHLHHDRTREPGRPCYLWYCRRKHRGAPGWLQPPGQPHQLLSKGHDGQGEPGQEGSRTFSGLWWLKRKSQVKVPLLQFFRKHQKHFQNVLAIRLFFFFLNPQIRFTECLHPLIRCRWISPFAFLYLTAKVSDLTLPRQRQEEVSFVGAGLGKREGKEGFQQL